MTTTSQNGAFPTLQGQKFMNLITFRKNGEAVSTPVWFAEEGNRLYVTSLMDTGKIKRIRNNSRVQLQASNARGKPLGPTQEATARILPQSEGDRANGLLVKKYGLQKRAVDLMIKLRGNWDKRGFVEIMPSTNDR